MKKLLAWFDDRTGCRALLHDALYENIPGGSRWRYVWGSTLVFTFSVQMITGIFLAMAYSPSSKSAWESVYYIQYEMQGGWLLRGIHHFTAQAMIVLLALHLLQVVIDGAYKAPREVNFWLGLILMKIVLGLSLTGYLLPWDQKGYWATRVATNLMGLVPFVGDSLQKLVVGGSDYGHATLTRFFALHAIVLPGMLIGFLVLHIMIFRRHGIHAVKPEGRPDAKFWPDQVLKDAVACLAVLAVVMFFVVRGAWSLEAETGPIAAHAGAELGAPADPAKNYGAARPEWYFLFLFQFLKYFEGKWVAVGALYVPGAVMGMLFLMPIVGRWKLGHVFNIGLLVSLGIGCASLTGIAIYHDNYSKDYSAKHLNAVEQAEANGRRAVELAQRPDRIPDSGAVWLMRNDPKTAGPMLFGMHCASCHLHMPMDDKSTIEGTVPFDPKDPTAPNLYGINRRRWITGLLDPKQIDSKHYFGNTSHKNGDMSVFVNDTLTDTDEWTPQQIQQVITALDAEANPNSADGADEKSLATIAAGRALIADTDRCAQCHKFHDDGDIGSDIPDLTGYRSRQWLIDFISNPAHERFYGDKKRPHAGLCRISRQAKKQSLAASPNRVACRLATWRVV